MLYGTFKKKIDIFDLKQIEESIGKNDGFIWFNLDELKLISNEINKNKNKFVMPILLPPIKSPGNNFNSKSVVFWT